MKNKDIKISLLYILKINILLAVTGIFSTGCLFFNQEPNYEVPRVSLDKKQLKLVDQRLQEIKQELQLSKIQASKVKEFLKIYASNILAIRKSKHSGVIKIRLAEEQVEKFEAKLQSILTKKQFKQYLVDKKERHLNYYRGK